MTKKLLRLPEVITMTGKPRNSIYRGMKDGQFPRPLKIGTRAVAWPEEVIQSWIASRVVASKAGAA